MIYDVLQKFIVLYVVIFSLYMIYFYFKNKGKKSSKTYTKEMVFLIKVHDINVDLIGKKKVEKHIALINSLIITVDILIYFYMKMFYLKIFVMFITTILLVSISYILLSRYYIKKLC